MSNLFNQTPADQSNMLNSIVSMASIVKRNVTVDGAVFDVGVINAPSNIGAAITIRQILEGGPRNLIVMFLPDVKEVMAQLGADGKDAIKFIVGHEIGHVLDWLRNAPNLANGVINNDLTIEARADVVGCAAAGISFDKYKEILRCVNDVMSKQLCNDMHIAAFFIGGGALAQNILANRRFIIAKPMIEDASCSDAVKSVVSEVTSLVITKIVSSAA